MSGEVSKYRDLVESLARRFVGRNGAEFDDLMQEGLLDVWQSLGRGIVPSSLPISNRMRDWVRLLGTQIGKGRGQDGGPIEYAQLLPLDDFRETHVEGVGGYAMLPNTGPDTNY